MKKPWICDGNTARRKRKLLTSVSLEVHPVKAPTAAGGKRILKQAMTMRFARGMRIFCCLNAQGNCQQFGICNCVFQFSRERKIAGCKS